MKRYLVIAALASTFQLGVSTPVSAPPNYIRIAKARDLDQHIKTVEVQYKLPPGLLSAIIETESNFAPRAINPSGRPGVIISSYGLGQVTMATARHVCNIRELRTLMQSRVNLRCTAAILKRQLTRYRGELRASIAAYQTGTACICRNYVYREPSSGGSRVCKFRNNFKVRSCSEPGIFVNQSYVNKVMKNRLKWRWAVYRLDEGPEVYTSL